MLRIIYFIILNITVFALLGCEKKPTAQQHSMPEKTILIKPQQSVRSLYFNGSLQPIRTISVTTPVDGRITEINFNYGDTVKKGQLLFKIDSSQLIDDYHKAITDFIKNKTDLQKSHRDLAAAQALYRAGVTSHDDFINAQNTYQSALLNYLQAKFELEKTTKQTNISMRSIEDNALKNTKTVERLFADNLNGIAIRAPQTGVALFPAGAKTDQEMNKKLIKGDNVKADQLLLNIGDLSGYAVQFDVNEIDLQQLKPGSKAIITGKAFPENKLMGYVSFVAAQANSAPDITSASLFAATVNIPHVIPALKNYLHVGMSAEVEIDIQNPPSLFVPMDAITENNGRWFATIVDAKTHQQQPVSVIPGQTTVSGEVAILQGLSAGDRVVLR